MRLFTVFVLCFLTGCASYRIDTPTFVEQSISCRTACHTEEQRQQLEQRERLAAEHWIYQVVPRHRCQIKPYDIGHWFTWALLGNDDDGMFGEAPTAHYKTEESVTPRLAGRWALRNPLHNFCFYVIGQADRRQSEISLLRICRHHTHALTYKPEADTVFPCRKSCLYAGFHGFKPFISCRLCYSSCRQMDFYLGWREKGNFGAKLRPFTEG